MIRSLMFAAVLAAAPLAALAQEPLPPASTAPSAAMPPSTSGAPGGQMAMTPEMRAARKAMMQACSADMSKLCSDAQSSGGGGGGGRGAAMQCMRQHMSELSDGCKSAMASMRAARQGGGGSPN